MSGTAATTTSLRALEDENLRAGVSANFAKNIRYSFDLDQDMERYLGVDFEKRRYRMFGNVNTSRVLSIGGGFDWGDEVYFDAANPFLGRESGFRSVHQIPADGAFRHQRQHPDQSFHGSAGSLRGPGSTTANGTSTARSST